MNDFYDSAMRYIIDVEGIYSDDPDDAGGETYSGISRRSNPDWEGWALIDRAKSNGTELNKNFLTIDGISLFDLVKYFYKKNYWDILNLDKLSNRRIAIKIFDISVNMGTKRAAIMTQNCLNICGEKGTFYQVDGIIGNKTIAAINSVDSNILLKLLTISQGNLYMRIVSSNPSQQKFLNGWINRLNITIGEF